MLLMSGSTGTVLIFWELTIGASIKPVKRIPRKKSKIKSLAAWPPRKDHVPNKYNNTLLIEKDKRLLLHVPNFPPVFISLINKAADDYHESTYTLRTDKDDFSCTNTDESMENIKSMNNINSYDE